MQHHIWQYCQDYSNNDLGWPLPILRQGQIWSHRLLYGKNWKLYIFWKLFSLWAQSWLKHSTKWVNEAKRDSEVKVILWPRPMVTHSSKLKLFSHKLLGYLKLNIKLNLMGEYEWKLVRVQMSWITWPRWPPCPYMVLATYFRFSFRFFKKGSCQLLAKVCAWSTG